MTHEIFIINVKIMASTLLFMIMAIIAIIILLIASITATIGAGDAFGSPNYNTDSRIRSAHQSLTIAAVLGWSIFVILIVILIVAAVSGGFTRAEVASSLLTKTNPTKADLLAAYTGEKELESGHTAQIIIIVVLFIIVGITLIVGILAITAAAQLGGVKNQDAKTRSAYTMSIVAAVSSVGGIGITIVALISYFAIRSAHAKQLKDLQDFKARTESQLGISPITQIVTPTHASQLSITNISQPMASVVYPASTANVSVVEEHTVPK